jgi:hypothetical protein
MSREDWGQDDVRQRRRKTKGIKWNVCNISTSPGWEASRSTGEGALRGPNSLTLDRRRRVVGLAVEWAAGEMV